MPNPIIEGNNLEKLLSILEVLDHQFSDAGAVISYAHKNNRVDSDAPGTPSHFDIEQNWEYGGDIHTLDWVPGNGFVDIAFVHNEDMSPERACALAEHARVLLVSLGIPARLDPDANGMNILYFDVDDLLVNRPDVALRISALDEGFTYNLENPEVYLDAVIKGSVKTASEAITYMLENSNNEALGC